MSTSFEFIGIDFHGYHIRTAKRDGEFWFFLNDIERLFGGELCISIPRQEIECIEMESIRGTIHTNCLLREAALYRLCFQCPEPIGEIFIHWLTRECYPKLRKELA